MRPVRDEPCDAVALFPCCRHGREVGGTEPNPTDSRHAGPVRIGTWNLAGRWSDDHRDLLLTQRCDVWLLTEVSQRLDLSGFALHTTQMLMAPGRHWAAVLSAGSLDPCPDPHGASAAARVEGELFISSVLPWRSAGRPEFWGVGNHAAQMAATLDELERSFCEQRPFVWGGDWNQSPVGKEYAGSVAGRRDLQSRLDRQRLATPTAKLPHQLDGVESIDHIAVPDDAIVVGAFRVDASMDGRRLSDHDMYVVDLS
jgi:hypothetical protein